MGEDTGKDKGNDTGTKKGFFYGWLVLLACVLIMALGYAPLVSCASLFTKPVTEDLGFTRSSYALVSTIASLMMAFMSPFVGKIMSKPYMHKALVVCMLGNCLAYCCYSFARTLPQFYITAACLGFFECGSTMIPVSVLVTNWFKKKRGLIMSIAMVGSSVGGTILSPMIGNLIASHGWRFTYRAVGITRLIILVPLVLLVIRRTPADMGLKAYGADESGETGKVKRMEKEWNVSLRELKSLPMFWIFVLGCFLITATSAVITQIPASIMDAGYATTTAASIASLYLFVAIPGKLILGHIFDRYGVKAGVLFGNTMFFLSVIALIFIKREPVLYLMAFLFGFGTCIGTVSIPVITSGIFGTKHYAEIYGFLSLFPSIGYAMGGPLIASSYDISGSYNAAWIIVAVLAVVMTGALLYCYGASRRQIKENEEKASNRGAGMDTALT